MCSIPAVIIVHFLVYGLFRLRRFIYDECACGRGKRFVNEEGDSTFFVNSASRPVSVSVIARESMGNVNQAYDNDDNDSF